MEDFSDECKVNFSAGVEWSVACKKVKSIDLILVDVNCPFNGASGTFKEKT